MMDVEIFLRFIIDIDFQLGNVFFCFCGDEQVVGRQNLQFFAFIVLFSFTLSRVTGTHTPPT